MSPRYALHHIDGNPRNNAPGNLRLTRIDDNGQLAPLTPAEHDQAVRTYAQQTIDALQKRLNELAPDAGEGEV